MPFENSSENLRRWHQEMEELVRSRGHKLISGRMSSQQREKCYTVYCPEHDHTIVTSFHNYKRSRTGCLWCGRENVSAALTGRVYSEETLARMRVSANSRPDRGGRERRWRETHQYRVWLALVRQEWNYQCAITGITNVNPNDRLLVAHHLVSASSNEALTLTVENGILIHKDLHVAFHGLYGYRENTVEQFRDFIRKIANNEIVVPISSQAESGGSEGSETRVYDPERIMELHERLGEINAILDTMLSVEAE